MLVLSRKVGESIQIGSNITLIVTEIAPNRIRLAIDAPPEMRILRGELAERLTTAAAELSNPAALEVVPFSQDSDHANSDSHAARHVGSGTRRARRAPTRLCAGAV